MSKNKELIWEDFESNYIPPEKPKEDQSFDFDDEMDNSILGQLTSQLGSAYIMGDPIKTPWGFFSRHDKLAPFNFYNIKMIYLKNFSVNHYDKKTFYDIMDDIDGLAVWKIIDPHCLVVGICKVYDVKDVRLNIEKALLADNTKAEPKAEPKAELKDNVELVEDVINKLKNSENYKLDGYIAIIFPNGKFYETSSSDKNYDEIKKEILDLYNKNKNTVILERSSSEN